jgi:hypothetical protein
MGMGNHEKLKEAGQRRFISMPSNVWKKEERPFFDEI